jgi:hypothetical protein
VGAGNGNVPCKLVLVLGSLLVNKRKYLVAAMPTLQLIQTSFLCCKQLKSFSPLFFRCVSHVSSSNNTISSGGAVCAQVLADSLITPHWSHDYRNH